MRSRWRGSMFAWILNTKPVKAGSVGSTLRDVASRGCGGGAHSTSACSTSRTPKLLMPEPKNTGLCLPARNASSENGALALRTAVEDEILAALPFAPRHEDPAACAAVEPDVVADDGTESKSRPFAGLAGLMGRGGAGDDQ